MTGVGAVQHGQTFGGKLQQPQTASHVIPVDPADTIAFVLLDQTGNFSFTLQDTNGQTYDPVSPPGSSDVSYQNLAIPGGFLATWTFNGSFASGNWTATVKTTDSAASDYALTLWSVNAPLQATAQVSPLSVTVGSRAEHLRHAHQRSDPAVTGATALASVVYPDGITNTVVTLFDDGTHGDSVPGDGTFTGQLTATTQPGVYAFAQRDLTGGIRRGGTIAAAAARQRLCAR